MKELNNDYNIDAGNMIKFTQLEVSKSELAGFEKIKSDFYSVIKGKNLKREILKKEDDNSTIQIFKMEDHFIIEVDNGGEDITYWWTADLSEAFTM